MVAGVQQHPNLALRRPSENSRKHRAAPNTRVLLFNSGIFHCAGAIEGEVLMRRPSR
jgi:hypothetical protein